MPGYLRDGHTIDDFLSDLPTVTKDQVRFAIERIDNESVRGGSSRSVLASIIGREAPALALWPMRVLVDECLPERIGGVLDRMRPEHRFEHVRALGWAGAAGMNANAVSAPAFPGGLGAAAVPLAGGISCDRFPANGRRGRRE